MTKDRTMSRIGKKPVPIANGVKVSIKDDLVSVEGPKGKLDLHVHSGIQVTRDEANNQLVVVRPDDEKQSRALHGLTRSLLANMIQGVSEGYRKTLEVHGVGYRAEQRGKSLVLSVGYAHTISVAIPAGVAVELEGNNKIHVSGPSKQLVGQFASDVRRVRKPEPYKGKGIRYSGEQVKIKAGKAFAGAGAK
jgi:large subunit ribosomal protein L6